MPGQRPSQPFQEDMISLASLLPMEQISCDWATLASKHFHIVRDRATSFIFTRRFPTESLANTTAHLQQIFMANGLANSIRTDGGPTYRKGFSRFLKQMGSVHQLEAAYASSSNGFIENSVTLVKQILTDALSPSVSETWRTPFYMWVRHLY